MAADEAKQVQSPGALLDEMGRLRRRARADRHAYWFPLLVFGLVEAGSAPFYLIRLSCPGGNVCYSDSLAGRVRLGTWHTTGSALYALLASLVGLGLTVWWYRWHARRHGVRTGTRGTVLAWTGASLGVLLLTATSVGVVLWVLTIRRTAWLLAVAVLVFALAWAERSVLLGIVAVLHAVAVGLGIGYGGENLLSSVLGAFGVADTEIPFDYGGTVNVLLPGIVLLAGGLVAFGVNRRRPA
jgi:hypothetical protein